MPVTYPPVSEVKATPRLTAPPSPESTVAGVDEGSKMVHGQAARAPVGVTGLEAVDCGPCPMALDADTRKVYVVPLVRPPTVAETAAAPTVVPPWALAPVTGAPV